LSLEGIDDVHGSDGLSLGVFGVGDGISDDVLEEFLENFSDFLVDGERNSFDSSSSGESSDGRLGNTFDHWSASSLGDISLLRDFSVSFS